MVCATGLHAIHKLLQDQWAYSVALDVDHACGTLSMDLLVCVCTAGAQIAKWHLIAAPLFDRKMAEI